jgi:hypothetical protein
MKRFEISNERVVPDADSPKLIKNSEGLFDYVSPSVHIFSASFRNHWFEVMCYADRSAGCGVLISAEMGVTCGGWGATGMR